MENKYFLFKPEQDYSHNSYRQINSQMFDRLICILDGKNLCGNILQTKRDSELIQWLINVTPKLDNRYSISNRIYWVLNDMHDFLRCLNPSCPVSGGKILDNPRYFKSFVRGYQTHCCNRCAQLDPATTVRKKVTTFERHGDENYRNRDKAKRSYMSRYGVDHNMKSEVGKQELRDSILKKYGVDYYVCTQEYKEKYTQTIKDKYGKDIQNVFQAEPVKEKIRNTCKERYGVENPTMSTDILQKALNSVKRTNMERYGVEFPMQSKEIRDKGRGKYFYNDVVFDSVPEIAFYVWLNDNGIPFEYQPSDNFEFEFECRIHYYNPDFKIIETGMFIELKGLSFFENRDPDGKMINPYDRSKDGLYEAKHQCMIRNNVQILTWRDYKKYIDYVYRKYGRNFFRQIPKVKDIASK